MRADRKLVASAFVLSFALFASASAAAEENGEAEGNGDTESAEGERSGQPAAEVKAAEGIEDREPVGASDAFEDGERVFIWSRVENAADTEVRHVWERNGSEVVEMELEIGGPNWRTWTRSAVSAGEYTVRVVGENDRELGQVSFEVE